MAAGAAHAPAEPSTGRRRLKEASVIDVALPGSAIPVRCDWRCGSVELADVPDPASAGRTGAVWIDTVRLPEGGRSRWTGTVGALELLVACERPPLPAGLIFHTGRCGSTLLANMLAAYPGLRVLSEPDVLSQLLVHQGFADQAGAEAVRLLFSAFSRGSGAGRGAVVKASNWHALAARRILAGLPGVPAVFIWRPAAEVVASCLHQPPPWSGFRDLRALLARQVPLLEGTDDPATAPVELFARLWSATVRAGLDLVRAHGDQVYVLAYHDLRTDPAAVGTDIAGRFGLHGTNALADAMTRAAGRYSKDLTGRTAFDPCGAHARAPLNSSEHAVVTRWTAPLETEIRSLRTDLAGP
jgi:hypothetical protein